MAHYKGSEEDFNREREGLSIRLRQQHKFEEIKRKLKEESSKGLVSLNKQFSKADLTSIDSFKSETIGLVTAEEFRKKRKKLLDKNRFGEIDSKKDKNEIKKMKMASENKKKLKKRIKNSLSFDPFDDGSDESDCQIKFNKKLSKNPNVNTSYLPDKERDEKDEELRQKFKREWIELQDKIKKEKIEVIFNYWDGSGHRKKLFIEKGKTIGNFLENVKENLSDYFSEFKSVPTDDILYVKSDFIIPHVILINSQNLKIKK